jgi:flagellar hook assembly protein FlgD
VDVEIRDASGRTIRRVRAWHDRGAVSVRWAGRDDRGRVVRDGRYTVRMTPRDRAGNVGKARTVAVRLLRVATVPRRDRAAISVRDGDRLATRVRLRTTIAAPVTVRWVIRRDGRTVATLFKGKARPGTLTVRWNGRDRAGRLVDDGAYTAVLVATSAAGTVRRTTPVWVGAFRTRLTQADRATGRRAVVHVTSTEPLARTPVVELRRKGMDPVRVRTKAADAGRSWARVPASMTATKGRLSIRVIGTDRGGQTEQSATSVRIR